MASFHSVQPKPSYMGDIEDVARHQIVAVEKGVEKGSTREAKPLNVDT